MLLELIATLCAGLGAAGLALLCRALTAKRLPRWIVPTFAGAGMLAFQIHSEYTWYEHQVKRLPAGVKVGKAVAESTSWKPWTYWFPQTLRFIAVDTGSAEANQINPDLILADLYIFERRLSARRIPQVFHCAQGARADLSAELQIPKPGEVLSAQWLKLERDDPLLQLVCDARHRSTAMPDKPLTGVIGQA